MILTARRCGYALVALVAFAVFAGHASRADGTTTQTLIFKELERGSTFVHIRNTKASARSNSLGDLFAFGIPLADARGKAAGRIHANCATTVGAKNFERSVLTCSGVIVLEGGTLTVQLNTSPGVPTSTGAITGGTGRYANARGVLVSKETRAGSTDTITLVD